MGSSRSKRRAGHESREDLIKGAFNVRVRPIADRVRQSWLGLGFLGVARHVAAFSLPARVGQLFGASL
jgi:hypothetical protein